MDPTSNCVDMVNRRDTIWFQEPTKLWRSRIPLPGIIWCSASLWLWKCCGWSYIFHKILRVYQPPAKV